MRNNEYSWARLTETVRPIFCQALKIAAFYIWKCQIFGQITPRRCPDSSGRPSSYVASKDIKRWTLFLQRAWGMEISTKVPQHRKVFRLVNLSNQVLHTISSIQHSGDWLDFNPILVSKIGSIFAGIRVNPLKILALFLRMFNKCNKTPNLI